MNKEETIIINDELFYRIPNGTSYDYAPIPKEFKPYFERLQQENKELHNKINKLEDKITQMHKRFINGLCIDNYLGGRKTRKLFEEMYEILKDSDVDE